MNLMGMSQLRWNSMESDFVAAYTLMMRVFEKKYRNC